MTLPDRIETSPQSRGTFQLECKHDFIEVGEGVWQCLRCYVYTLIRAHEATP